MSSTDTNVGSPPCVRRTSCCARSRSTCSPSASIACPLRVGVRLGDARILVHARHAHRERRTRPRTRRCSRSPAPRCPGRRCTRAECGPSPASRPDVGSRPIQPAPGRYAFGPRVQVGEVAIGARRTVERLHVGDELDQVARREARGEPEVAQDLHEQPARVAARAAARRSSVASGVCTPGSIRTR